MNRVQLMARRLFESRSVLHIVFSVFFIFIFCLPGMLTGLPGTKVVKVIIYSIFLLNCIYAGRWCCRKWLLTSRFDQFIYHASISIIVLSVIAIIGSRVLTYNNIWAIVITSAGFVIIFFSFGVFLSLTHTAVLQQLWESNMLQQQNESELQLLRSQLSPHFLFNTLNNLYGLSITQHQKIPGLLLKLSDLLRYSVYDTKQEFVPLNSELTYIENYIELEKTRLGERLMLNINIQKAHGEDVHIPPMLLIVFVENAFKHSKNTFDRHIWIDIDLRVIDNDLLFIVKNSCPHNTIESRASEESGVGLANTLKRLELLYSGRYSYKKNRGDDYYEVKLQLKVK